MRWKLLSRITALNGNCAEGVATTDFPHEVFADHFPGFPVTPGVLIVEMCAQLAGRLVEIRCSQSAGRLMLPVLTIIREARFRTFVPRAQEVRMIAELEHARPDSALCGVVMMSAGKRVASMKLVFAFDPSGSAPGADREALESFERAEFERLGLGGFPPADVTVLSK